jgi:hypothetical protein
MAQSQGARIENTNVVETDNDEKKLGWWERLLKWFSP